LLSTSTLMTPSPSFSHHRSASNAPTPLPTPLADRWSHVRKGSYQPTQRDSRSSVSSTSTSNVVSPTSRTESPLDWENGSSSRIVSLKRSGISPRAPQSSESEMDIHGNWGLILEKPSLEQGKPMTTRKLESPAPLIIKEHKGWERISFQDSPPDVFSPSPPTSSKRSSANPPDMAKAAEEQQLRQASVAVAPEPIASLAMRTPTVKRTGAISGRRKSEDVFAEHRSQNSIDGGTSSSKSGRVRSKRYHHRATPSMQYIPSTTGSDTTNQPGAEIDTRTKKGSSISSLQELVLPAKEDGLARSPRMKRLRKQETAGVDGDDEDDGYTDLLLAYEKE